MPRGRHRHSPPLHRLLPPSAIAGVSVVCALGPWVFSEATVVRALAAAAAATTVVGAVVLRRWDTSAGKQVADLTRARVSDEWRYEERIAELETDLEESRELRTKLEQRLRAKRAELAGLRNEHAALLRRYATAETERASALEGRRLLEVEATLPVPTPSSSPALPPARSAEPEPAEQPEPAGPESPGVTGSPAGKGLAHAVFSPEGAQLYRRALAALARFGGGAPAVPVADGSETGAGTGPVAEAVAGAAAEGEVAEGEPAKGEVAEGEAAKGAGTEDGVTDASDVSRSEAGASPARGDGAHREDGAEERPAAAGSPTAPAETAEPVGQPPAGHFTVPTAVAVAPSPPVRRPVAEGGFDFFGTQKGAPKTALDSVQNEDLADVVGQEALAVHKAETEAEFKPAGAQALDAGQVIDLTAHDATEQIDIQGLRSAAS
ncbi:MULTISPECIES: hypothetical protein [Streptomyces]|uniref:hypothetical protein n=1 Tax=Streptomyces TaxID=1883 RepID=UPI000A672BBE|nr:MULTISPECIES: hypothetical protein [Streptomyces]MCH0557800.1 hypothetical protein [Streptomyces sp. MUM 16J]